VGHQCCTVKLLNNKLKEKDSALLEEDQVLPRLDIGIPAVQILG